MWQAPWWCFSRWCYIFCEMPGRIHFDPWFLFLPRHLLASTEPYDNVGREPGDRIVLSWDIALSEAETGDYSACVVLLSRGEVFYVLEVLRGRFPFDVLKRKVMEVKQRYGSSTLLIEDSPDQSRPHPEPAREIDQRHGLQARYRQARSRDCAKRLVCGRLGSFSPACRLARGIHRGITRFSRAPRRPGRCAHPGPCMGP